MGNDCPAVLEPPAVARNKRNVTLKILRNPLRQQTDHVHLIFFYILTDIQTDIQPTISLKT